MESLKGKVLQLSAGSLREKKRELASNGRMTKLLNDIFWCAEKNFSKEPDCVKKNAKMTLDWNEDSLVLVSGKGLCEINVSYNEDSGKPDYHIRPNSLNIFVGRIVAGLITLSIENLEEARRFLDSWEETPDHLKACFDCAIQCFQNEPLCVQENAKLVIHCDIRNLPFVSGNEECEIIVSYSDGEPVYTVSEPNVEIYLERLGICPAPLSVGSLERARNTLESFGTLTQEMRGCFDRALQVFREEAEDVQENALMVLLTSKGRLTFESGNGEIKITIFFINGEFTYIKMPQMNGSLRQ